MGKKYILVSLMAISVLCANSIESTGLSSFKKYVEKFLVDLQRDDILTVNDLLAKFYELDESDQKAACILLKEKKVHIELICADENKSTTNKPAQPSEPHKPQTTQPQAPQQPERPIKRQKPPIEDETDTSDVQFQEMRNEIKRVTNSDDAASLLERLLTQRDDLNHLMKIVQAKQTHLNELSASVRQKNEAAQEHIKILQQEKEAFDKAIADLEKEKSRLAVKALQTLRNARLIALTRREIDEKRKRIEVLKQARAL